MKNKIIAGFAGITLLLSSFATAQDWCGCECGDDFWLNAEYLYWKIQDSPKVIPLVVEGPDGLDGDPVLNQPNTTIILGDESINNNWRSGARFGVGYWFDGERCLGVEANYFFLPTGTTKTTVFTDGLAGSAALYVPFIDVTTGLESSYQLADPSSFSGLAVLKGSNDMQGAEINLLTTMPYTCESNIVLLAGFRYWNFHDRLSFDTNSPDVPPGTIDIYETLDKFHVQNNFYGGQVGVKFNYTCNQFFVNVEGKVALGALCQKVNIGGTFTTDHFSTPGTGVDYVGGLFALPTNIGGHSRTTFSVLPEVKVDLGYMVTDCFRVKVGYSFLYVSNVLWASKQLSRDINPTQSGAITFTNPQPTLNGEAAPVASLKGDGLWVQGVNAGIEFTF